MGGLLSKITHRSRVAPLPAATQVVSTNDEPSVEEEDGSHSNSCNTTTTRSSDGLKSDHESQKKTETKLGDSDALNTITSTVAKANTEETPVKHKPTDEPQDDQHVKSVNEPERRESTFSEHSVKTSCDLKLQTVEDTECELKFGDSKRFDLKTSDSDDVTPTLQSTPTTVGTVDTSITPHMHTTIDIKPVAGTSEENAVISVDIAEIPEAYSETSSHKATNTSKNLGTTQSSVILVKPCESSSANSMQNEESMLQNETGSIPECLDQDSTASKEPETVEEILNDDNVSHHSVQSFQPEADVTTKAQHTDYCKSVHARLMLRESEKPVRDKVTSVLKTWKASGKLEELEKSVKNIKETSTGSITDLAKALKRDYNTESTIHQIALAYKVYCWVTTNIRYSKSFLGISDPKRVLKAKFAVCHGYSTLFQAICREGGLEVTRLEGNARSLQDCKWSLDDSGCHTWNMVKIENVYFQVDCTHGSGTYTNDVFKPRFTRAYFFPAPHHLIVTHWVDDEMYQLLEHPAILEDLQELVVLDQMTISAGIKPETLAQSITLSPNSASPSIAIEIGKVRNDLEISATLEEDEEDTNLETSDICNHDNSLTLIQWNKDDRVTVHAALPTKRTFPLKIFSAKKTRDDNIRTLRLVYNVTSERDENESSEFIGYPKVYESIATENEFVLLLDEGGPEWNCKTTNKIEMKFKSKQNAKFKHSICEGKVKEQTENRLKCYTHLKRDESDPELCYFTALFPKRGWWTVFLVSENDTHYTQLMRYQVYATDECKGTLFPHIHTDTAEGLGISLHDEHTPISYDSNQLFQLKFTTFSGLVYKAKLIEVDEFGTKCPQQEETDKTVQKQCRTYVSVPREGTCTGCVYSIVPPGTWCLDLFANEPQCGLNLVISTKILHGSENMKLKVFPKVYSSFSRMSLSPPPNLDDWVLPEVVEESEYPKTIKIGFIQHPSEVQLSCSVKRDDQDVPQTQDIAKIKTLPLHQRRNDGFEHNNATSGTNYRNRIIEVVVTESGKWTYTLLGRSLQENSSLTPLMDYTVRGL